MGNCQQSPTDINKSELSRTKAKSQLQIKTYTWTRDSHGLYDYEGKNLSKKSLKTYRSGLLTRNGDDIRLMRENEKNKTPDDKDLIKFVTRDGNYWVMPCNERKGEKTDENTESNDNGLWLVVKSMKMNSNKGFPLNEGDHVKLGRIKFRVKEAQVSPLLDSQKPIKTEIENDNDLSMDNSMVKSRDSIKNSTISSSQTCRICLSESTRPGNPFFSPCHCSGTMKYVHIKCLQRWLKSKMHIKDSGQSISIYWKTLECELCKTGYPNSFMINDQKYDIIEIERPHCAYLMLEILSKDSKNAKGVHIIKMENKNNIRLGRGHDSDIRITDISVSRCHAIIKLEKGKFYLEDNNSKFGTLVNLKKPFCVAGGYNNISLQAGRTLITLHTKKNKTLFPVCFSHAAHNDSSHEHEEVYSDIDDRIETEHNIPNEIPHSHNENNRISNIPRPRGDNFDDNLFIENLDDQIPVESERQATLEANRGHDNDHE